MRERPWFWFLGLERWDGGFQIGLGLATLHYQDTIGWAWWWNRD